MIQSFHRYTIEYRRPDGETICQRPVEDIDWEPARERLRFEALRGTGRVVTGGELGRVVIQPLEDENSPIVTQLRAGVEEVSSEVPEARIGASAFFRRSARAGSAALVEAGTLEKGSPFLYQVYAYPDGTAVANIDEDNGIVAIETQADLLVRRTILSGLLAGARPEDPPSGSAAGQRWFPALIPEETLAEANQLAESGGAREVGGILVGRLHRDPDVAEVAAEVTALIPCREAAGDATSLQFAPDDWAAVEAAIRLRGRDEMPLGWFHSHPAKHWCKPECPPEARRQCPLLTEFFSEADEHVHATVFPAHYSIALVATLGDEGITNAVFGWGADATIERRPYHIITGASIGSRHEPLVT